VEPKLILITGATRSRKSRFAQELAKGWGGPVAFIATAAPRDEEMERRIEEHRRGRPRHWVTIEEERELVRALESLEGIGTVIIDCLTLWVSNLLEGGLGQEEVLREAGLLRDQLLRSPYRAILVTNEVGWGIVPVNPLARRFRDTAGMVNQLFASSADEVYLMVAGIPLRIKPQEDSG